MTTSARTTITTEKFVRPRSALAQIKRFCDEMAEQERVADQFHTLLAVDSDVVHMAAFPLDNLNLGSVFHAWGPLRTLAKQVRSTTRQADTDGRRHAIEQIFAEDAARIPMLTTIALAEYIFKWRAPDDGFKSYAILPPHELERNRTRQQARDVASRWHDNLPNRVRATDIRQIMGDETDIAGIAGRLLDQMPETLSVLFPAQLRADHAERVLHEMELSGVVSGLEELTPTLPGFSEVLESAEAKFVEEAIFKHLLDDAMRSSVLEQLSQAERDRAAERIKNILVSDARVLTWLQQINLNPGKQITIEIGGETKKFRAILITASARVWRTAREFGLAETCLRNPVAYLGEGRFFDWAFKDLISEEDNLFATLRRGKLSQWLEPLVNSPSQEVVQKHSTGDIPRYLSCVHEWERLMSHLATSLNLSSPTSGLQRAIADAKSGTDGYALVMKLTTLLSKKIIDVTLRLSKSANVTGLMDSTKSDVLWRNLPPLLLESYPDAESVLNSIRMDNLADDVVRDQLIERIINLESHKLSVQDKRVARDYLQTIMISLLWMRMGQWVKARDVVKSAVGFVRSIGDMSETAIVDVECGDIRGDEALYLLAVTGRLAAKSNEDLQEAHTALRYAEKLCVDGLSPLRFLAEEQSRGVAEVLFAPTAAESSSSILGAIRLEMILRMFENEPWQALRTSWKNVDILKSLYTDSASKAYSDSYSLQQMYCAILMRYMLAYPPLQDGRKELEIKHRETVAAIFEEFESLVGICQSGQFPTVSDSATTTQIRAAYLCWTDPSQRDDKAGGLLRTQFRQLLDQERESGASGLDRRRTEWMYRYLASGWLV